MNDRGKAAALAVLLAGIIILFLVPGVNADNYGYLLSLRGPKTAAILLTACATGFSAVLFQTIAANRVLTPAALGLDSLYLLMQTLVVFSFGASHYIITNQNLNFALTAIVMVASSILLFRIMLKRGDDNLIKLILVGTIFGQLFRSLASFLMMIINPNESAALQNKIFASFNNINTDILLITIVIFGLICVVLFKELRAFDVLSLGRTTAVALGIDYDRLIRRTLVVISILVSVSTALVGPIAFLGLLTANLARQISGGYRHSMLLAYSMLTGAIFLLGGQLIIERLLNFDVTVSVLVNLAGGLYFIYLLIREARL